MLTEQWTGAINSGVFGKVLRQAAAGAVLSCAALSMTGTTAQGLTFMKTEYRLGENRVPNGVVFRGTSTRRSGFAVSAVESAKRCIDGPFTAGRDSGDPSGNIVYKLTSPNIRQNDPHVSPTIQARGNPDAFASMFDIDANGFIWTKSGLDYPHFETNVGTNRNPVWQIYSHDLLVTAKIDGSSASVTEEIEIYITQPGVGTNTINGMCAGKTYAPVNSLQQVAEPLTASFKGLPEGHDGSTAFTLTLEFSESVSITTDEMRDHALKVNGGTVTAVTGSDSEFEITIQPDGEDTVTVLSQLTANCDDAGAICTSDGRKLSVAPLVSLPYIATRQEPPVAQQVAGALTASFVKVGLANHDGSRVFSLHLRFSEEVFTADTPRKNRTVRDALTVTGGTLKGARRLNPREYDAWKIRIKPDGDGVVTVSLPETTGDCTAVDAFCTPGGVKLSGTVQIEVPVEVPGAPTLSVNDAMVKERSGAVLSFDVVLSRPAPVDGVYVDYETRDITAKAGVDYMATTGVLTFRQGDTQKTVSVPVLDDSHDEGEETMSLVLSLATGAILADSTATGTISNTDHMPAAFLSRFGRTVADQVVEAVGDRMTATREPGLAGRLADQEVGMVAGRGNAEADFAVFSDLFFGGEDPVNGHMSRALSGHDLLTGTSFALSGGPGADGSAALWGRGAFSSFDGQADDLMLDGDVRTGMLGVDWTTGGSSFGLLLAHSRGKGDYSGAALGRIETRLSGLYPWLGYAVSDALSFWGVAGFGQGSLTLTPQIGTAMETDIDLKMAAAGLRGTLANGGGNGFDLAWEADALTLRTTSDAVAGLTTGNMVATSSDVSRLRLGLSGSRSLHLASGAVLTPGFEIGVRHDGGDADTGFGTDIGASLDFADRDRGIAMTLRAHGLIDHAENDFSERGVSASFTWDPRPETELGWAFSLNPTVGSVPSGGGAALFGQQSFEGLVADDDVDEGQRRFDARLGYGVPAADGRFIAVTEIGLGISDTEREYSTGWRLSLARSDHMDLALGLKATRRESGPPAHDLGVGLGFALRW